MCIDDVTHADLFHFYIRFLRYQSSTFDLEIISLNMPILRKSILTKRYGLNQVILLGLGSTLFSKFQLFFYLLTVLDHSEPTGEIRF